MVGKLHRSLITQFFFFGQRPKNVHWPFQFAFSFFKEKNEMLADTKTNDFGFWRNKPSWIQDVFPRKCYFCIGFLLWEGRFWPCNSKFLWNNPCIAYKYFIWNFWNNSLFFLIAACHGKSWVWFIENFKSIEFMWKNFWEVSRQF